MQNVNGTPLGRREPLVHPTTGQRHHLVHRRFNPGVLVLLLLCLTACRSTPLDVAPLSPHMSQGLSAYRQGDFAAAVSLWRQAANDYQRPGQLSAHRQALIHTAQALGELGHYHQAIDALHTAHTLSHGPEDGKETARIFASLGHFYVAIGQYQEAQTYLQDARRLAQASGDRHLTAVVLNNVGNLFMSRKVHWTPDFAQAWEAYQQSASLALAAGHLGMASRAFTQAARAALQARQQLPPAARHATRDDSQDFR